MKGVQPQDLDIARWLPAGVGVDDAIAVLAAMAVLTTLVALWHAFRPKDAFERRLQQVVERRETMRRTALAARNRRQSRRPVGLMRAAVTRLNLLRSRHAAEARLLLSRAGMRSSDAMVAFLFARLSLPTICAVAALMDSSFLRVLPMPHDLRFVPAIGAALLGFYAPKIYLSNAAAKRAKRLQLALPDGLDLMVICAEAGLSLDATLLRVSRELANSFPELAEEFAITTAELTFLPDRRLAFDNLNNRTDSDAIRAIVNTLQQTAKFGTPLAQSLRVLSAESRAEP
jgi:tight adherence protein C